MFQKTITINQNNIPIRQKHVQKHNKGRLISIQTQKLISN